MRELPLSGFVKICGVTTLDDALMVERAGADAVGLILSSSSRQIDIRRAVEITSGLGDSVLRTLVFRDAVESEIVNALAAVDADMVQIHGPLDPVFAARLRERVHVVKALSISGSDFHEFNDDIVSAVLIDGPSPGSGMTHSWTSLKDRRFTKPVIVAGGLRSQNVVSAIEETSPWGVDCASGVESSPGAKDPTLVARFVQEARRGFDQ